MILPKRLEAIASLIDDNVNVIDVGCDHAYLDIYLTQNRKNVSCYACDINKNALDIAKKNITKYNLNDKIKTILCDGISNVDIDNKSIIVISGMGASTINHILDNSKVKNAKEIIIQSNNDLEVLRKFMVQRGFYIYNEKTVFDRGKYYVIIDFKKGEITYKKYQYLYGPILIKNVIENKDYFEYVLKQEKNRYKKIPYRYFSLKINSLKKILKLKKIMCNTK